MNMGTAIVILLLIIWLVFIQFKLSDITTSLNELKKSLLKDKITNPGKADDTPPPQPEENKHIQADEKSETVLSISDIPDDIFFNSGKPDEQPQQEEIKKTRKKQPLTFENLFLGNIFNKIGAIAILVALIILIKLVSPYFVLTPQLKAILGYLAGFGLMIGGLRLHTKPKMQNYAEVLVGTGFGALFISTYCACSVLKLINLPKTIIISTVFLLSAFYLADRLKTTSMLVITLIAAYLNPIVFNAEFAVSSNFLFGYLIFTNLLALLYTYKNNSKKIIPPLNLCITFVMAFVLCSKASIAYPIILWGLYTAYDLITLIKEQSNKTLNYINLAVLTILMLNAFWGENNILGYIQLGCAAIYGIIACIKRQNSDARLNYIHMALISAFLFVIFFCSDSNPTKCIVWSIETAILAYYAYKYKLKSLAIWAIITWAAAYCSILTVDGVFGVKDITTYVPVWNIRLAMLAPLAISSGISYYILKQTEDDSMVNISEFFRFAGITTAYLYAGLELNNLINKQLDSGRSNTTFIKTMTDSMICSIYAINLKQLQSKTNFLTPFLNVISGLAGTVVLALLIFAGCRYKPMEAFIPLINIRTLAFLTAISAFVLYAKWTKKSVFKYIALILGFILVHFEISDVITKYAITEGRYLISICWILYSGIITTIGILRNKDYLKITGIILSIISVLRVFFYDLAEIDILYKFIAVTTLGFILMIVSYIYNKKSAK